eukprot:TRINITY_DN9166_c0_g1_i1.p1 TRINITY_DN9166_c0_g1~~TRINITY_DN9166_c0_g1_i1.p1  ORF type:complete len:250 (-),score=33.85 TRINITY_DN9166_c0_g1_i1:27-776(-)
MWITPEAHKGPFWSTERENEYFTLLRNKMPLQSHPYRIVIKSKPRPLAVAIGSSAQSLLREWQWLEELLQKNVTSKGKSALEEDEMIEFLMSKLQSVTINSFQDAVLDSVEFDSSISSQPPRTPEEKKPSKRNDPSADFQALFDLPGEVLVAVFACSLWRTLPTAGSLYASENYLCFVSPFMQKHLILPFSEIRSIQKVNHKTTNAIKLQTSDNQVWLLAGFPTMTPRLASEIPIFQTYWNLRRSPVFA